MESIFVAAISTVGVIITTIIQTYHARKKDKIEDKLELIRKEFKAEINNLKSDINNETLGRCKSDLVSIMSKVKNGYTPTDEEKRIILETKELYNSKSGDSYVDDMFDTLKKEGKL